MSDVSALLNAAAQALAGVLTQGNQRIVFAESCTGGLVAASLSAIPGISDYLCGSAVTYRGATKTAWLGVDAADVERDSAVNDAVAREMAAHVLERTPESSLAISVTGHLGPEAPPQLDGTVFIGIAHYTDRSAGSAAPTTRVTKHELHRAGRRERQMEAAILVLVAATESLSAQLLSSPLDDQPVKQRRE